jgi:hypothetical protein
MLHVEVVIEMLDPTYNLRRISVKRRGASIKEAAKFLSRADSVEDVARKCEELGLKPKAKS